MAARLSSDSMKVKFINEKASRFYEATIPLGV